MSPDRRIAIQRVGLTIGVVLILWQALTGISSATVIKALEFSPRIFLYALGFALISYSLQVVSWRTLMIGLGVNIPWKSTFSGYTLSFLPRYIPGSVWGYLSRSEWLRREYGVKYAVSGVGSLLEIIIALSSTIMLGGIYFAVLLGNGEFWVIIGLLSLPFVTWFSVRVTLNLSFGLRFFRIHNKTIMRMPLLRWLVCSVLNIWNMILYGLALYFTSRLVGLNINFSLAIILSLAANFSLAWLIGFMAVIFPAGLGLREITLSALLNANMGLSFEEASLLSVLFRVVLTAAELSLVMIALIFQRINR